MFIPAYFFIMAVCASFAFIERDEAEKNRYEQLAYVVFVMVMFCIAAFRPIGFDNDSLNYVALFNGQTNDDVEMELSFNLIVDTIRRFTDEPRVLFVVYALLAIPIKAVGMARASRYWMLTLVTWMGYYFIYQDFTQIRIAVSTGIFLFALSFHARGQKGVTLLLYLLAIFFHSTAVAYLPLLFMGAKPLGKWGTWVLALLPAGALMINLLHIDPIVMLPIPQLQVRIDLYEKLRDSGVMGDEVNSFNIVFLSKLAIFYFILWKRNIAERAPWLTLYLKVFVYSICTFLIFSFLPVMAFRLSEVTGVIEILLFPCIVYAFREEVYGKLVVVLYAFMQTIQAFVLTHDTLNPDQV